MAKRRVGRRKANTARRAVVNPKRRYRRRRRHNPVTIMARTGRRRAVNGRHKRRYHRRRNPSAAGLGNMFKEALYGALGAIVTRVGASVVGPYIPASFQMSPFAQPILQAAIAAFPVRMIGKKFLGGQKQADLLMAGGLISAGLAAFDAFVPNLQGQLTSFVRAPVALASNLSNAQVQAAAQGAAAGAAEALQGMGDVYDVGDSVFQGFGDVEDVPAGIWAGI